MAIKNTAKDASAAALAAVEQALGADAGAADPLDKMTHTLTPRLPGVSDRGIFGVAAAAPAPASPIIDLQRAPAEAAEPAAASRPAKAPAARVAPAASPANDDRPSVGQMLAALQPRPSRTPYVFAAGASLVWIALGALYVFQRYSWDQLADAAFLARPESILALLTCLGPVFFAFIAAALVRRAQEMRQSVRSMSEVAIRLIEPETLASDQIMSLSQAIRREVASMGDGIERALARASELETMMRSEVSNLERSYGDNERRIRSLIDELSSEREAIVANTERVRGAIGNAHESLSSELETVGMRLADRVSEAGNRVAACDQQ